MEGEHTNNENTINFEDFMILEAIWKAEVYEEILSREAVVNHYHTRSN